MWRKGNSVHFGASTMKTVWRLLKKLKIQLPNYPAIPLLGIYPKKTKPLNQKDIYTPIIIAALFTVDKILKQPNCRR